ncbi:MAG: SDR family oxidoreductase, partial [Clostridia bacterium]|nr:SDR family oxidoreductase [Clostridia bacterium]
FHMLRAVYPLMAKQRSGRILNISSVAGLSGNAGQANYAASKAGLIGMTKSVARELAARGITCNAIAPGFIATDMTEKFAQDEKTLSAIPVRRMGTPDEVAALAAYLCSPHAAYITGEVIRIDGGMMM